MNDAVDYINAVVEGKHTPDGPTPGTGTTPLCFFPVYPMIVEIIIRGKGGGVNIKLVCPPYTPQQVAKHCIK